MDMGRKRTSISAYERFQEAINEVLADPSATRWLKAQLVLASHRDPVDALNDATLLTQFLKDWVDDIFENASHAETRSRHWLE